MATRQGKGQRVVAIADIHGDLDAFVGILQRAQLIDRVRRWSGANAILVQTGDFLDRGPKAREVMDFLMTLQKDAPRQGGRVIVLMGNHEAMNVFGDLRYVTADDYRSFAESWTERKRPDSSKASTEPTRPAGYVERCAAFGPNGKYGKWIRSLPAIARVQDSIFLHGGISSDVASYSVEQLNEAIAAEIRMFDTYNDFLVDKKIAQKCSTFEELVTAARSAQEKMKGKDAETIKAFLGFGGWLTIHENGPLWFRGYAQWTDEEGLTQIEKLTTTFGVARFVVGHTPQTGGRIVPRFNEKVYLIDTGMLASYFPGGRASALAIQEGKVTAIY